MLGVALALLVMVAIRQPSADIRIMTHDSGDSAPHRIQAAVDLGVLAVNVLITWTARRVVAPA